MSDRVCIRGCAKRDVHYATCTHHGPSYRGAFPCRGCAPRECRDGSLICDGCFGRMRRLLEDTPDLLGRLRSIGDPLKATPSDQERVGSTSTEPPAPVGADLLDAIAAVTSVLNVWDAWDRDLSRISNILETVEWLGEVVLDRHPESDGVRPFWSVQDAVDKWGVERRDRHPVPYMDDVDRVELTEPVAEWRDPLIGRDEAELLAGTPRTLQRWIKGGLPVAGEIWVAGRRVRLFRRSEVEARRELARARQEASRSKGLS